MELQESEVIQRKIPKEPEVLEALGTEQGETIPKEAERQKRKELADMKGYLERCKMQVTEESEGLTGEARGPKGAQIRVKFFYEDHPRNSRLHRRRFQIWKNDERCDITPLSKLAEKELPTTDAPDVKGEKLRIIIDFIKDNWSKEDFERNSYKCGRVLHFNFRENAPAFGLKKVARYKRERTVAYCVCKAAEELGIELDRVKVGSRFPADIYLEGFPN